MSVPAIAEASVPVTPEAAGNSNPMVGKQIGKYRVAREVGRGGMGAVYEAKHETLGQRIAIKVLNEEYCTDTKYVQRFFDEARAVNIVQHPGLVKVFDFGHLENGTAYITMEFLNGESLQERVERLGKQGSRMEVSEALRIARQVASALEAVHQKGIAHRDRRRRDSVENFFRSSFRGALRKSARRGISGGGTS